MNFKDIIYEKSEGIATIKINRTDKRNSLSQNTWTELAAAFSDADADGEVRVVIITGAERTFSTGDDISEFGDIAGTIASAQSYVRKVLAGFTMVEKLTKPVIAAVNGLTLGGGFELALASDIIIASENATFGLPEGRIGAIAGFAVLRLPRIVGSKKAMEMLLTGDTIDALQAEKIGVVNKVVPEEQLEAEAREMAKKIMRTAPLAANFTKQMVNSVKVEEEQATNVGMLLLGSNDLKEGFDAFMNKRRPTFKGQ